MAATMRVATPVQVAVARDKPAEKEPSGGDDRFSNLLSQRQPRDDNTPAQHVSTPKSKTSEPGKQKEDKPDDTLHLLQSSAAIQPSVTPPPPTDQLAQPQSAAEAVDDVLSKSAPKTAATPVIVATIVSDSVRAPADPVATIASSPSSSTDATPQIAELLQTTVPKGVSTDSSKAIATQSDSPAPTLTPAVQTPILAADLGTDAPTPKPGDASQSATLPANPNPSINVQAAQLPVTPQAANPTIQLDFSNAAPAIIATTIAVASAHHAMLREVSPDDSLDPIDTTSPTGATQTFSVPEHHDIATLDGKIPVPAPSSPQFADALGAKLTWMAERHIGHAEIRLSPDDLGTVDVRIRLNGEHVRAEFNSANPEVRQAINDHIPRLRDMLSQHGFNLAESHVGNGSNRQTAQTTPNDAVSVEADDEIAPTPTRIAAYTHDGILDAFA